MLEQILSTQIQNTSVRSESSAKRKNNIQWIIDLFRTDLTFRKNMRQILITTTQSNEELFIQYPGKETARNDDKLRPWDFFPRVRKNNDYGSNLDFQAIWDILYEGLNLLISKNPEWATILATVFYRMAFMKDHILTTTPHKTTIRQLSYDDSGQESTVHDTIEEIFPLYQYSPAKLVLQSVSDIAPSWGGMSFEAFLHFNDLLAWNEDCKYYYRMQQTKPNTWIRNTGRVNTLLTHLSIIGYVSGKIRFSEVCIKFARGKGVAPATRNEILRVCNGYITK